MNPSNSIGRIWPDPGAARRRSRAQAAVDRGKAAFRIKSRLWQAPPARVPSIEKPLSLRWERVGLKGLGFAWKPHAPPRRRWFLSGVGQVSWLEAALLAPSRGGPPSGLLKWAFRVDSGLSQWRGRAGFSPASGMTHPPCRFAMLVSRLLGPMSTLRPGSGPDRARFDVNSSPRERAGQGEIRCQLFTPGACRARRRRVRYPLIPGLKQCGSLFASDPL